MRFENENNSHLRQNSRLEPIKEMTLADLKPGQTARIQSIDTQLPGVVRLMVLGLVEGADVRFRHAAIGGDPLEFSVFGTSISIRKEQARQFKVNGTGSDG